MVILDLWLDLISRLQACHEGKLQTVLLDSRQL